MSELPTFEEAQERKQRGHLLIVAMRVDEEEGDPAKSVRALLSVARGISGAVVAQIPPDELTANHYDRLKGLGFNPRFIEDDLALYVTTTASEGREDG